TLVYAERVSANSAVRQDPEYSWLVGAARFQQKDYSGAEASLRAVLESPKSDSRHKAIAANGLVGVYEKLNRPIEKLRAAVEASTSARGDSEYYWELYTARLFGWNLDFAYALDIQLTDSVLEEYLNRYGSEN